MGLGKINNWGSILRFTTSNDNWGYYGVRNPAMWFHPNSYKFHFTYYTSHGQKHYDLDGTFSANQDFDIEIEAIGNYIKCYVNDVQKFSLEVSHTYRLDQSLHYEFMLETITFKQQMLGFQILCTLL